MKLIIGLGNPGKKYENTRHNVGFMVVDSLVKKLTPVDQTSIWYKVNKPKLTYYKLPEMIITKPLTYMNLSGLAVSYLVNFFKIEKRNVWVVHDDIDLPLGKLRIRRGGASAGHHGIESMIASLKGSEFVRFRIGVGKAEKTKERGERNLDRRIVEKYVLSQFFQNEEGELRKIIKKTVKAVEYSLTNGIEKGMNRFN